MKEIKEIMGRSDQFKVLIEEDLKNVVRNWNLDQDTAEIFEILMARSYLAGALDVSQGKV